MLVGRDDPRQRRLDSGVRPVALHHHYSHVAGLHAEHAGLPLEVRPAVGPSRGIERGAPHHVRAAGVVVRERHGVALGHHAVEAERVDGLVPHVEVVEEPGAAGGLGVEGEAEGRAAVERRRTRHGRPRDGLDGAAGRVPVEIALDEAGDLERADGAVAVGIDVEPPQRALGVARRRVLRRHPCHAPSPGGGRTAPGILEGADEGERRRVLPRLRRPSDVFGRKEAFTRRHCHL